MELVRPPAQPSPPWERIVREHSERVIAALLAFGLDRERATEIAQQTWSSLFEKFHRGELTEARFPGLALRHARFRALDHLRLEARERRRRADVDEADEVASPIAAELLSASQVRVVKQALARCSPSAQKLFRIVYTRPGISHAAVADQLGLSVQRVRQSLCEIRKTLRQALENT